MQEVTGENADYKRKNTEGFVFSSFLTRFEQPWIKKREKGVGF
jgi:hypothetical protein